MKATLTVQGVILGPETFRLRILARPHSLSSSPSFPSPSGLSMAMDRSIHPLTPGGPERMAQSGTSVASSAESANPTAQNGSAPSETMGRASSEEIPTEDGSLSEPWAGMITGETPLIDTHCATVRYFCRAHHVEVPATFLPILPLPRSPTCHTGSAATTLHVTCGIHERLKVAALMWQAFHLTAVVGNPIWMPAAHESTAMEEAVCESAKFSADGSEGPQQEAEWSAQPMNRSMAASQDSATLAATWIAMLRGVRWTASGNGTDGQGGGTDGQGGGTEVRRLPAIRT